MSEFHRWLSERGYRVDPSAPLGCLVAGDRIVTAEEIIDFANPPKHIKRCLLRMLGIWT